MKANRTLNPASGDLPAVVATTDAFEQAHHCDTVWGPGVFPALY